MFLYLHTVMRSILLLTTAPMAVLLKFMSGLSPNLFVVYILYIQVIENHIQNKQIFKALDFI